jgi:hypothetical protein
MFTVLDEDPVSKRQSDKTCGKYLEILYETINFSLALRGNTPVPVTVLLLGGSGLSHLKAAEALTDMSQIPGFSKINALKFPSDPI